MIDILTGTAFDAPKQMHHRDDEVALEFPFGVSSRRRGLLALKAQNWRAGGGAPLPYDYEVEYIGGTGIQYVGVVVNVPVNAQYEFRVRAMPTASGAGWLLSSGVGSFGTMGPAVYGTRWYVANVSIDTNNPIDITLNNDGSWYGGVKKIDGSFVDKGTQRDITMMCRANQDATYRFVGRVYGLEIDLNGALVKKLVPCVKDGVPCFYDEVGGEFMYDKSGTGFVAGPRI